MLSDCLLIGTLYDVVDDWSTSAKSFVTILISSPSEKTTLTEALRVTYPLSFVILYTEASLNKNDTETLTLLVTGKLVLSTNCAVSVK